MSKISKRLKEHKHKSVGDHKKFLTRITKTLYYGKLSSTDALSLPVTELAAELFSEAQQGRSLDRLHCSDAALISRNACVSPCSLVLALLYLEKLKTCNPEYLKKVAPSELFLVSLLVSCKFLYDDGEDDEVFTDEWAVSGGISHQELVQLERDFLKAIDWNVFVHETSFWKKLKALEISVAKKEGLNRGWFTYTELENLLEFIDVHNLIQCVTCFSAILLVTYTASLLTMLCSVVIVSHIPGTTINNQNNIILSPSVARDFEDDSINETEELMFKCFKSLDAADVLKTGIFLASIKVLPKINESSAEERVEIKNYSWEWWENPLMQWLTNAAKILEKIDVSFMFTMDRFKDACSGIFKLDLGGVLDKATKVRIQEQMERSWHKEWTDCI